MTQSYAHSYPDEHGTQLMREQASTLSDYILWRGDLSFDTNPINPCDYLLFAVLSYSDIPALEEKIGHDVRSVAAIAEAFLEAVPAGEAIDQDLMCGFFVPPRSFFEALAQSPRYKSCTLVDFEEKNDDTKNIQFGAYTWNVADQLAIVSYRGTDMSLAGWKEDFLLGIEVVPAQILARAYLSRALVWLSLIHI